MTRSPSRIWARRHARGAALLAGLVLALAPVCTRHAEAEPSATAESKPTVPHSPVTPTTGHGEALPSPEAIAALPPDGGPDFNRLVFETSPYLRQHARNPVDWYAWGEEAFAKARAENKPIFLSIGYSSCHWCHVMAHESFEDEDTAALMNQLFINIKVDREERPDLDDIYMKAVQLITGRGGWPMSVFLLPDGRPYYGGTYFPREDSGRGPGFKTLLSALSNAYHEQKADVDAQANQLAERIKQDMGGAPLSTAGPLSRNLMQAAIAFLGDRFDAERGGFSGAPKFPPHMSLDLLLYEYERTGREDLRRPIVRTLDAMMLGGVHDHVGGGFHRYSTDAVWLVPHFEKMLYDNAQLARAYATAYRLFGDARYRAAAEGIADWVLREMTDEGGGFYSALDADSEGEEGKFYVWTREEILAVLGDETGDIFCQVYNVRPDGNFHEEATGRPTGTNIPHLRAPIDTVAAELGIPPGELQGRLAEARTALLRTRATRVWPGLDDKVLTSWNGLMIAGLAEAGTTFERPAYVAAAEQAATFILTHMRRDGRLLRTYNNGQAKLNGYLDDYAFLTFGLLELHAATGDDRWLTEARALVDVMFTHYGDDAGGFYFTSDDHEELLARDKNCIDGAVPSGNGVAARVLVRLAGLTGDERFRTAALASFDNYLGWMQRAPGATESLILALAEAYDTGVVGGPQVTVPASAPATAQAAEATAPDPAEPDATWASAQVSAKAYASQVVLNPGARVTVAVELTIADGWHVNSHAPLQDYLIPTDLTLAAGTAFEAGDGTFPEGEEIRLTFSPDPLSVYAGTVWLALPLTAAADAPTGAATADITLTFQACDDRQCLRPVTTTLSIPVTIVATPTDEAVRHPAIFEHL